MNPANDCLFCNTAVSPLFWSAKANGDVCSDGDACSYGDRCSFGSCLAIPYECIGAGCCVGDGTCTSTPPTGVVEQCQNGVDDDCDGVTDEGEPEVCADNADNDCDGATDEAGNTWGEVFFARGWRTPATVSIYTSNYDGTFMAPKVLTFPTTRPLGIVGVGDFDADRFNDLVVAEWVYQDSDFLACGAGCAAGPALHRRWLRAQFGCSVGAGDTCNAVARRDAVPRQQRVQRCRCRRQVLRTADPLLPGARGLPERHRSGRAVHAATRRRRLERSSTSTTTVTSTWSSASTGRRAAAT